MSRRPRAVALCGAVITACVWIWSRQGDQTGRVASHLALYGTAFAAYLGAVSVAAGLSRRDVGLALGAALLWRLALIPAPPLLSDDVYRSVWEGRIQAYGGNPYAWEDRPEASRWAGLRDDAWRRINHKDYTAIYPPLWQLAARGVVALSDSVAAMKAFLVACEGLTLWVLARMLVRRGLPPGRLLIMAWSPLALVEVAGSGHNEPLALLLLVLALAALDAGRPAASALLAALGALAKLLPGLVALAWARRFRPWHLLGAAAGAALVVAPYAGAGVGLWMSLGKFGEFWRFNETLFVILLFAAGSHTAALRLAGLLLAALVAVLAWKRAEPEAAALTVILASLLLVPNVLPWYALWLLPFLVLSDNPGALLFTGTAQLAYLVYPAWQSGERWQIGWGIRALEYGPCMAVFAWSWLRGARRVAGSRP